MCFLLPLVLAVLGSGQDMVQELPRLFFLQLPVSRRTEEAGMVRRVLLVGGRENDWMKSGQVAKKFNLRGQSSMPFDFCLIE